MSSCALALWLAAGAVPPSDAWVTIPREELHASYDTLWAVSDLHGRKRALERLLLAAGLAAPTERGARVRWNPGKSRQLFIVVGDSIDGGDSAGTVLLLRDLQREAEAAKSRVIVLLGNHEVAFLAGHATPAVMRSESGDYLRSLPVAAFVGTWLFAHAGYLEGGRDPRARLAKLARHIEARDRAAFEQLLEDGALVGHDRWWAKPDSVATMKSRLDALGLDGLAIGHDPDALGAAGTIALSRNGWLMKLDTGLKRGARGMLLRCPLAEAEPTTSAMSRCGMVAEDGARLPMAVR